MLLRKIYKYTQECGIRKGAVIEPAHMCILSLVMASVFFCQGAVPAFANDSKKSSDLSGDPAEHCLAPNTEFDEGGALTDIPIASLGSLSEYQFAERIIDNIQKNGNAEEEVAQFLGLIDSTDTGKYHKAIDILSIMFEKDIPASEEFLGKLVARKITQKAATAPETPNVVLGSTSPRRVDMFRKKLNQGFQAADSQSSEYMPRIGSYKSKKMAVAFQKAWAVAVGGSRGLIVGSDTTIKFGDAIVGKIKDGEDPVEVLKNRCGREMEVISGVIVIDTAGKVRLGYGAAYQKFKSTGTVLSADDHEILRQIIRENAREYGYLTEALGNKLAGNSVTVEDVITAYVKKGKHAGKAGGFGVQDREFATIIDRLDGDLPAVIGLPEITFELLRDSGVRVNNEIDLSQDFWPDEKEQKRLHRDAHLEKLFRSQKGKLDPVAVRLTAMAIRRNAAGIMPAKDPLQAEIVPPFSPPDDQGTSEVVLFFKPECFKEGMRGFSEFVNTTLDRVVRMGGALTGVRVMNGPYLKEERMIDGHYGAINRVYSDTGNIPQAAKDRLAGMANGSITKDLKGKDLTGEVRAAYGNISPQNIVSYVDAPALIRAKCPGTVLPANEDGLYQRLWAGCPDATQIKVAGGVYTRVFTADDGTKFVIVNGFHYEQLQRFYKAGRGIITVSLRIPEDSVAAFRDAVGDTDSRKAAAGTLRNTFLLNHFPQANDADNGIHFSAGYLEGYYEYLRFFPDARPEETALYKALLEKEGNNHAKVLKKLEYLSGNPSIKATSGEKTITGNIFDLTECKSFAEAVDIIHAVPESAYSKEAGGMLDTILIDSSA